MLRKEAYFTISMESCRCKIINSLDIAGAYLASTNGQQSNGLVDTAQRRHIDGLATDGTLGTDTGGVLTGTAVDNSVNSNLERALVGHDVDLHVG